MSPRSISPHGSTALVRFDGRAVLDAHGCFASPGSLIVEFADRPGSVFPARVLAAGSSVAVDRHDAARAPMLRTVAHPDSVLIPGLVNAHTHLDLTHIGPQPHDPGVGFVPWVEMIRQRRHSDPVDVAASVRRGAELSLIAGVVAVGDIAGAIMGRPSLAAYEALADTPLFGASFVEFFAIGAREQAGLDALAATLTDAERRGLLGLDRSLQLGFQPHSPYSVSPKAFRRSLSLIRGRARTCTHLAETVEERMLITRAAGPFRTMLEGFGLWNESLDRGGVFGHPVTPVEHLRDAALHRVPLFAHVNDASDSDLDLLARAGATVAYCPRASAYFGAATHFGPHRYRDMLARGVNVALGTDSIVNLPPSSNDRGIGILDEMRFLHARDATPPLTLLRMGTGNGAAALGLPPEAFGFAVGASLAGAVAVPIGPCSSEASAVAYQLMATDSVPRLLFARTFSYSTESRPG